MNNVIPFPKPPVPPIRCVDPVDELYALAAIAETRAEKAGQKLERDCDRALGEIEELLATIRRML